MSIIIPTFRRENLIHEAINSVLSQIYSNWEIIIVADGCDYSLNYKDDRIKYTKLENNLGKSAAINHALPMVNGKYIWILDDDDVALPEKLAKDIACLESHPEKQFVYSKAMVTNLEINQFGTSQGIGCSSQMLCFLTLVSPGLPLQMGTLVIRNEVLKTLKFDETLRLAQDTDFVLRLASTYEGHFIDEVSIYWRFHGDNSLWASGREQYRKLIIDKFWKTCNPQLIFANAFNLKSSKILAADESLESKAKGQCLKALSYISRGLWQEGNECILQLQQHLSTLLKSNQQD